jgi:Ice-binding-like
VHLRFRLLSVFLLFSLPASASVIAPNLGNATSFGMLGGTISNTGTSIVAGNVGATITITGFPPGTATGTVYAAPGDPTVNSAYNDFLNAFNFADSDVSTPPGQSVTDLTTNRTFLGNNVFTFPLTDVTSTTGIELTFDAQFDSREIFIIKIARDLTINGCVYAETANTLAGTTQINGCSASAAPEPQSWALMALASIIGLLLFQRFLRAPSLRPAHSRP